ncbi:MAG TPA: hypothetical protein IAC20_05220 [Candidatus Faecisoma merdavium]|nr:hypothetical protein [Candidatus Faecisoma merdavium]
MQILKKIKINNRNYYAIIDLEYKKIQNNFPVLRLKNYKDDYWDSGDCSILIERIEENYSLKKAQQYDNNIAYMNDILYIYDRMPFISGIKDISISNNMISEESYISKEEIEKYIKEFNIKMNHIDNFKLSDSQIWKF